MEFDTGGFLAGLFGGAMVSGVDAAREEATAQGDLATDDPLAASPFANWVRRPDVTGRMGWEAPDVPETDRWWARSRFDELPEVNSAADPTDQQGDGCYWCGRQKWWRSVYGAVFCGWCHPPAVPGLVAEWLADPESDESLEAVPQIGPSCNPRGSIDTLHLPGM